MRGKVEGGPANRELDCMGRRVVIGHRQRVAWARLPVAKGAVAQRCAPGRLVSRELIFFLGGGTCGGSRAEMDAHEDYVWPRATSELILLPVTGLECVGERLLAGEVRCEARASGDEAERSRGRGHGTKGCPQEAGRRSPGGGGHEARLEGPRQQKIQRGFRGPS